eukprot:jgi/Chrpa1/26357/Chrysochromulina_OHIO_Genome00002634-RA
MRRAVHWCACRLTPITKGAAAELASSAPPEGLCGSFGRYVYWLGCLGFAMLSPAATAAAADGANDADDAAVLGFPSLASAPASLSRYVYWLGCLGRCCCGCCWSSLGEVTLGEGCLTLASSDEEPGA